MKKLAPLLAAAATMLLATSAFALFSADMTYESVSNGANNYTFEFKLKNTSTSVGGLDFFMVNLDADPNNSLYTNVLWSEEKGWANNTVPYDPSFGTLPAAVLADDSIFGSNGGGILQGGTLGGFKITFDYFGTLAPSQQLFSWYAEFNTNLDGNGIPIGLDSNNPDYSIAGSASGTNGFIAPPDPPDTNPVPEPGTMLLLGFGMVGLYFVKRNKSK